LSAESVVLEQTRQQLARQEAALNSIRNQALAVFSASGVAAALFAPHLLTKAVPAGIVAGVLFVAGTYSLIQTIKTRDFDFGVKLPGWFEWLDNSHPSTESEAMAASKIAKGLDGLREANKGAMKTVADWHNRLCWFFGLQVAAWIVAALIR
jgi:hypothetical protein